MGTMKRNLNIVLLGQVDFGKPASTGHLTPKMGSTVNRLIEKRGI